MPGRPRKTRRKNLQRNSPDASSFPLKHGLSFNIAFPVLYSSAFALLALIIKLAFFQIGDIDVETDFYGELVIAAQKLSGGEFSVANYPFKGPFYSFALIPVQFFVRDWYLSGIVLNLLCAAGSLVLVYRLVLRTFNRELAVFSVISVSLVFEFFLQAHKATSDMLFLFLCLATMAALWHRTGSWQSLVMAGGLSGFAFLTRYNGIFLPVATITTLLMLNPRRWPLKRRFLAVGVYSAGFLTVCSPWFVISLKETGQLIPGNNLQNLTREFYGIGTKELGVNQFSSVFDLVAHDPLHFVGHYLGNIPGHFWLDMKNLLGVFFSIPLVLGMLRLLVVQITRLQLAFFIFPFFYFLLMCFGFHLPRLSLYLTIPYAVIAYALLFESGEGKLSRPGRVLAQWFAWPSQVIRAFWRAITAKLPAAGLIVRVLIITVILLSQIWAIIRAERYFYAMQPRFILDAATVLKGKAPAGDQPQAVMARKPHIAYYSGMTYIPYPRVVDDPNRLVANARERQADFIIFSPLENLYYPGRPFLQRLDELPGISCFHRAPNTILYEVDDIGPDSGIIHQRSGGR